MPSAVWTPSSQPADVSTAPRQGKLLRDGLTVVLIGQPNVGKSRLLNRLAGDELAIVTEVAGTTRDTVRETIQIEGVPLHIIDTAGLRDTDDEVEKIGIERSWREIERADVVLLLVDARSGVGEPDREILARLPDVPAARHRVQQDRSFRRRGRTSRRSRRRGGHFAVGQGQPGH